MNRYLAIWFPMVMVDWIAIRMPSLKDQTFVLSEPDHGRKIVTAASVPALQLGVTIGMNVADARAIAHDLQVLDYKPGKLETIMEKLARWCIRFSPIVALEAPDMLIIDASGCAHLWDGERLYMDHIRQRLQGFGYHVRMAMADTVGAAWAVARFGQPHSIIAPTRQTETILELPPAALRLPADIVGRLEKLGFSDIRSFSAIPRKALRRRFGELLCARLDQALGNIPEPITGVQIPEPYEHRLAPLDPILTRKGIEFALEQLLSELCNRLGKEGKGLRIAVLQLFRIDGHFIQVQIGTNRPSSSPTHLFKLFEEKITTIAPGGGIEVFCLQAKNVEECLPGDQQFWSATAMLESQPLAEFVDRITNRLGPVMHRFLPAAHYWPERSLKISTSLAESTTLEWEADTAWPIHLFAQPQPIDVAAPIPDYPPISFRYLNQVHYIKRADGPKRIEREWWIEEGQHRDYYLVEDSAGCRYWVFRSGHYDAERTYGWFLHGYFA